VYQMCVSDVCIRCVYHTRVSPVYVNVSNICANMKGGKKKIQFDLENFENRRGSSVYQMCV